MTEKPPKKPKISKSKYELTLAEFPMFLLSKGGRGSGKDIEHIKYNDVISGKDGELVERNWIAYPDGKLGFGSPSTLETFFDLFQIWKEENFNNQFINFGSVYSLLKRKGAGDSVREYKQVIRDLHCLVGVRIEAKNAFWDNELKAYVDMTFHLFDYLQLYKEKPSGQATLPFARIKASDVLYGSVLKNSILITDFDSKFFHSLTPVEQRLALYLSKIFRSQTIHKRNILELARQIPLYAKQTKHIKERLKKASKGLIEKGFKPLESFEFEKSADKKSELIVFKRNKDLPKIQKRFISKSQGVSNKDVQRIDLLVEDILAVCKDKKSEAFYRKAARLMPDDTIYRAISEVKEVRDLGQMRRSEGALFTSLIRRYAEEQGIDL